MNEPEVCEMICEGLVGLDLNMASCRTFAKAGIADAGHGVVLRFRDRDWTLKQFQITVVESKQDR